MNDLPVVLCLRVGKTKGRINIAFTDNMGYAQIVAFNHNIILLVELSVVRGIKFFNTAAR